MKRSIAVVAMLVVGFAATTCAQTGREIAQKVNREERRYRGRGESGSTSCPLR